jgi:hypothetical protein
MSEVLGVIAIAVLLVLIIASVTRRRGIAAAERDEDDVRIHTGEAQHAASLRRLEEVRAAPTQAGGTMPPPTDE